MTAKPFATVFKEHIDSFVASVKATMEDEIRERMPEELRKDWTTWSYSSDTGCRAGAYLNGSAEIEHDELICFLTCKTPDSVADYSLNGISVLVRSDILSSEYSKQEIEYRAAHIVTLLIDAYLQDIVPLAKRHIRIRNLLEKLDAKYRGIHEFDLRSIPMNPIATRKLAIDLALTLIEGINEPYTSETISTLT